mmetsp:Transcript_26284/g.76644  ORF Transcript_26284/g.76644 Transcript_26284/m.76644 type:complete len:200 (+) Transcript_26284:543-1142(+)
MSSSIVAAKPSSPAITVTFAPFVPTMYTSSDSGSIFSTSRGRMMRISSAAPVAPLALTMVLASTAASPAGAAAVAAATFSLAAVASAGTRATASSWVTSSAGLRISPLTFQPSPSSTTMVSKGTQSGLRHMICLMYTCSRSSTPSVSSRPSETQCLILSRTWLGAGATTGLMTPGAASPPAAAARIFVAKAPTSEAGTA